MSDVAPRLPLETKFVPIQGSGHESFISVTPGAKAVRDSIFRSSKGRSLMNLRFTTCPVSASSVWIACACALTSTVCVAPATFNVRLAVAFSFTSTLNLALSVLAKPAASTLTTYTPGRIERNKYPPILSEVVWKLNPTQKGKKRRPCLDEKAPMSNDHLAVQDKR